MDDIIRSGWEDVPHENNDYEIYVSHGTSLMNALALAAQKWPLAHPSEVYLSPLNLGNGYLKVSWSHKIITHI